MLQQAMAWAQQRCRDGQRQALIQALRTIEEGKFGDWIGHRDEIDGARLWTNTTITRSMSCEQG